MLYVLYAGNSNIIISYLPAVLFKPLKSSLYIQNAMISDDLLCRIYIRTNGNMAMYGGYTLVDRVLLR